MAKKLIASLLSLILMLSTILGMVGCGDNANPGVNNGSSDDHEHEWVDATCTEAKSCTICGMTDGMPAGHTGGTATCEACAVCTVCGLAYGDLGTHDYVGGACTVCGATDPNGSTTDHTTHLYNVFTSSEKTLFTNYFGFIVPFIPNDEYYVDDYTDENGAFLFYYTYNNTEAEFNAYREAFSSYTYLGEDITDDGTVWYLYTKNDAFIDLAYYIDEDGYNCVDVYVYFEVEGDGDTSGGGTTSADAALVDAAWALPVGDTLGTQTLTGVISEMEAYSTQYKNRTVTIVVDGKTDKPIVAYRLKGTGIEDLQIGDTIRITGELMNYKTSSGAGLVEFHSGCTFVLVSSGAGSTGGDTDDSGTVGGENLPTGTDGVYDVNFTDAVNVKDVTDQGYYLGGCPTVGSPGVLVIPVDFSDYSATTLGYNTSVISNAFMQGGKTDYYSVYDYYYMSSYGQLTPDITVLNFWFRPQYASTYYEGQTTYIDGYETAIGDQMIINEALIYLDTTLGMDLSQFDSDGNGMIDAVIIINSVDIDYDSDFHWAYRYWNYYTDANDNYYEYDGVSANDYLWASYEFLFESYDENGDVNYDDTTAVNTYTYIHEFGHILGADDYYDTTGDSSPMGGCDVMDAMAGDQNAFTKFNLGWVTTSRLVTTDTSVTLKLENFSQNGDTIIIANNWDPTLGAYQEYYIVVYYKSTGLNGTVDGVDYGYFLRDGIVVYHVNAALYTETIDGETYYDIYNNNSTPNGEYGSEDNLIEFVLGADDAYTYVVGDTLPTVVDDNGDRLAYTFTVTAIDENEATLTFNRVS